MVNSTRRCGAIVVLFVLAAACGSSGPTSPTVASQASAFPSPTPPPATQFPPLSLTVRYNDVMLWTDFEDAVYVRTP